MDNFINRTIYKWTFAIEHFMYITLYDNINND